MSNSRNLGPQVPEIPPWPISLLPGHDSPPLSTPKALKFIAVHYPSPAHTRSNALVVLLTGPHSRKLLSHRNNSISPLRSDASMASGLDRIEHDQEAADQQHGKRAEADRHQGNAAFALVAAGANAYRRSGQMTPSSNNPPAASSRPPITDHLSLVGRQASSSRGVAILLQRLRWYSTSRRCASALACCLLVRRVVSIVSRSCFRTAPLSTISFTNFLSPGSSTNFSWRAESA